MSIQERFNALWRDITLKPAHTEPIFAGSLLQRAAQLWPHRTALLQDTEKVTFHELYEKAKNISLFLHAKQVTPQDRIVILYENSINFFIAYYGAWQTGAIIVPVNIFLQETELNHIFSECTPHTILVSTKLQPKVPTQFADKIITQTELETLIKEYNSSLLSIPHKPADELAALLYTSGTTGLPKGVMLSSRNIITSTLQGACEFHISPSERVYALLPLFHVYLQNCCLWGAILVGAATIIVPKIDRSSMIKALKHNPTVIMGIPQLYGLFCIMKRISFPFVKFFICGGDALPDKIRLGFELIYKRKICNGYGLTEASPTVSINLSDAHTLTNNVGKPVIGLQVSIRSENPTEQPSKIGTLYVKGANIMMGYYKAPEATQKVLQDGWLNTGDLAMLDEQGNLLICGREKDLIVNKGIKIYPQEVENVIMSHHEVTSVGVIGLADGSTEVPIAYVAVKRNYPELAQELEALCKSRLAPYKIPRNFYILRELPTTATGKVNKKELRKLHEKK